MTATTIVTTTKPAASKTKLETGAAVPIKLGFAAATKSIAALSNTANACKAENALYPTF